MRGPHQFVSGADACERHGFASSDFFTTHWPVRRREDFPTHPPSGGLVGCRRFQAACAKTQRRNLVSLSWIRFSPTLYNMAVSVCSHTFFPQRSRVATTPGPGPLLHALPLKAKAFRRRKSLFFKKAEAILRRSFLCFKKAEAI